MVLNWLGRAVVQSFGLQSGDESIKARSGIEKGVSGFIFLMEEERRRHGFSGWKGLHIRRYFDVHIIP